MKAIIIFRRLKDWRYQRILEQIIFGLIRQEYEVEIQNISAIQYKKTDILIQWYNGSGYTEISNKFKEHGKLLDLHIEKGWFDRDKHFLLYDTNGKRYESDRVLKYDKFKKNINRRTKKVWMVMGQMKGDYNLINCKDYATWKNSVIEMLTKWGTLPVYYRSHPCSFEPPKNTLDYDLGRAEGIVSWNSSGVLKAMMHQIPVCIYDFPELVNHVQVGLTREWVEDVEAGRYKNKNEKDVLLKLAGQQVSIDEFSIYNFRALYDRTDK